MTAYPSHIHKNLPLLPFSNFVARFSPRRYGFWIRVFRGKNLGVNLIPGRFVPRKYSGPDRVRSFPCHLPRNIGLGSLHRLKFTLLRVAPNNQNGRFGLKTEAFQYEGSYVAHDFASRTPPANAAFQGQFQQICARPACSQQRQYPARRWSSR